MMQILLTCLLISTGHCTNIPTSDLEMDSLITMINARMAPMHESNNIAHGIRTEQLFNAIRKLKNDKRDGLQDF